MKPIQRSAACLTAALLVLGACGSDAGPGQSADAQDRSEAKSAAKLTAQEKTEAPNDDVAELSIWADHGVAATSASQEVIEGVSNIASSASSDLAGWLSGGFADESIAIWSDATAMLDEWESRPQPVPAVVAECDALATTVFELTLSIADKFSDLAIVGSTDSEALGEVLTDLTAASDQGLDAGKCMASLDLS